MKEISIAIVEDEKEAREKLLSFLKKLGEEEDLLFKVAAFSSSIEFIETYKPQYQLLFFDIAMPEMTGMQLAHELRKTDTKTALIFVTSLAQYAVESYDVGASNYILKPLSYPEFKMKVMKVILSLPNLERDTLLILNKSGSYKVNLADILYCETSGHMVIYHTKEGEYPKRETMKEAEEALEKKGFFRINSCYLVRLSYVASIDQKEAVLKDGTRLSISRPRYRKTLEAFQKTRSQELS
ncbi:MAG: LytTR family DNA-binding domain-containing protein [Eubacteriales bacterium]|nr:LytTR family DNA-binding domain-containing protein [Eubacteriales bacterium]